MEPQAEKVASLRDLWLFLPAVAEIVDEQDVTVEEAMEHLNEFLGPRPRSPELQEAIKRLESTQDELTFREMLSSEWIRCDESIER